MIKTEKQIRAMKLLFDDGQVTDKFFRDSFPDVFETLSLALKVVRAAQTIVKVVPTEPDIKMKFVLETFPWREFKKSLAPFSEPEEKR